MKGQHDGTDPHDDISEARKRAHAWGVGGGLGFFLSATPIVGFAISAVFFFTMVGLGDFSLLFMVPAVDGIILGGIGMFLTKAGIFIVFAARLGRAGSGLTLDPRQAREDLQPWARLGGKLQRDGFEAMGVDVGKVADRLASGPQQTPVVKVRCRSCSTLNDEQSKFCRECGQPS